jgi:gluconate 5-dehydrogenase
VDVPPERLVSWIATFAQRHGGLDASRAVTRDEAGATLTFTAADGATAQCHPPFPPPHQAPEPYAAEAGRGADVTGAAAALAAQAVAERTVGVLLVRLGGYAVGVFAGSPPRLESSKTGSRPVHGRSAAGGWSQHRFARRRENQAATALRAAADAAAAVFGEPDILVNCAGVNVRPPMAALTPAEWDLTMAVNLTAPFLLGQRFGPSMAARGWGRIINVTSQQAHRAFLNSGGYGASKGGLAALTRSQSEAWAGSGVCCNSVCPGFVPTRLNAAVAGDPARSAAMAARTMAGRNGEPADFAGATVFLASPASDYVTGHTIYVDGGFAVT